MDFSQLLQRISEVATTWPLMIYVTVACFIYTIVLRGIQFRYLFTALKSAFSPSEGSHKGEVSPFHAFMNTINSNLGNGIIAGVSTAIYAGGPGAAFWLFVFGCILMSIRFGEVYVSTYYGSRVKEKTTLGGPMLYLKHVPGGTVLPFIYAVCCVFYGLIGGNMIQANSIAISLAATWGVMPLISSAVLGLFVLYILFGGAQRVAKISLSIVPVKVVVFMFSTTAILLFHYKSLIPALSLIISSGLGLKAFGGGLVGFSMQQMISAGMLRSIFSTESGVGSAAIMFGSTGNHNAVQNGFMGMISTFISTCLGFIVALCIVVSGVWNSGLNSTALTISAFDTVFGAYGGWLVSFLSISFGLGVLVSYVYVTRAAWSYVTNHRFMYLFMAVYAVCACAGALATVDVVWYLADIIIAAMLFVNLYGLVMLLPRVKDDILKQLRDYKA